MERFSNQQKVHSLALIGKGLDDNLL